MATLDFPTSYYSPSTLFAPIPKANGNPGDPRICSIQQIYKIFYITSSIWILTWSISMPKVQIAAPNYHRYENKLRPSVLTSATVLDDPFSPALLPSGLNTEQSGPNSAKSPDCLDYSLISIQRGLQFQGLWWIVLNQ